MSGVPNAPTVQEDLSQLTDEEKRKILKPDPSKEDVHQILVTQFVTAGQSVQVCNRLESYDDCNYLVTLDGTKYILKVHNGVESDAYQKDPNQCRIALLRSIFRHLQEHSSQVQSSQIVSPQDGHSGIAELNVVVQVHSPRKLAVTLLSYVEGTPMCNVNGMGLETLVGAGQYLGHVCHSMDNCPQDMKDLGQSLYHAWDGKNTADILPPFLQYITCSDRRQLVQSVLDAFSSNLSHFQSTFRKGLLQADFNDANILLQPNKDHGWKVSGVIDFGDSTYSWRVLDVSVAMSYAMMTTYGKTHRSLSAAAAMLRGVHSIYPLTEEEIANLRLLMAVRLACSATLGAYSIAMNPDNEYLKLHAEPAWNSLSFLMNPTNTASIDQFFQQACTSTTNHKDSLYCTDLSFPDPSIPDCLSSIRTSTTEQQFAEGSPPKKKNKPTTTPMSLVFVTGNAKKLEEVQRILQLDPDHFKLSNRKIDLPELQGEPLDIAREKCALAAQQVDGAVITEDTSLCFNALKELPGPYIKWFLDKCGLDGLNQMIEFSPDKTGYAQTVVAYTTGPNQPIHLFDGRTAGTIVSPRGPTHFGWDPIFQPEDSSETYAEMSKESKDAISHRGRAFSQLRQFLQTK